MEHLSVRRETKILTADIVDSSRFPRKEIAANMGISYQMLCRWCDRNEDTYCIPVDRAAELAKLTGDYRLQEFFAERLGALFMPVDKEKQKSLRKLHELIPVLTSISKVCPDGLGDSEMDILAILSKAGMLLQWSKRKHEQNDEADRD